MGMQEKETCAVKLGNMRSTYKKTKVKLCKFEMRNSYFEILVWSWP